MRQIVLDTETTGLDPLSGDRVIEIGAVELVDRKPTGNHFHEYLQPDREVPEEAIAVHGITNEFLRDKPRFADVADAFFEYIRGAELIIHNSDFDMGFLNHEYRLMNASCVPLEDHCGVLDTLRLARQKHPGQRNTLDALCKRYCVDNQQRTLHGALLDAEILADVYLFMTGGQTMLSLGAQANEQGNVSARRVKTDFSGVDLPETQLTADELASHRDYMSRLVGSEPF